MGSSQPHAGPAYFASETLLCKSKRDHALRMQQKMLIQFYKNDLISKKRNNHDSQK